MSYRPLADLEAQKLFRARYLAVETCVRLTRIEHVVRRLIGSRSETEQKLNNPASAPAMRLPEHLRDRVYVILIIVWRDRHTNPATSCAAHYPAICKMFLVSSADLSG